MALILTKRASDRGGGGKIRLARIEVKPRCHCELRHLLACRAARECELDPVHLRGLTSAGEPFLISACSELTGTNTHRHLR